MAVYKVIQDIESEDKLLGPLSLKGFIYAAIAGVLIFLSVRLGISGIPTPAKLIIIFLFLPPTILFAVLASPLGREQPTEVWLLSRVRFMIKNKKRIWDQSGIKNLVTVTAPKKEEVQLTKNLSQTEVSSRLQALANTLDSRGWAIKNVNLTADADDILAAAAGSDRLASASTLIEPEPVIEVHAADDILDERNNPTAQKFVSMVEKAEEDRRFAVLDKLDEARTAAQHPDPSAKQALTPEEKALLDKAHQRDAKLAQLGAGFRGKPVTQMGRAAKLELADSGSDLSVATIARLANRNTPPEGEVSVELH